MLCFANIGPNTCSRTIDLLGHNKLRNVLVRRVVRGNKQGTLSVLRFILARPHLLIFVLVPLLFTNALRFTCYVLRVTFNVTSRSNTRARIVVTQHISISSHTIQPESTLGNREAMAKLHPNGI